jgi:transposase
MGFTFCQHLDVIPARVVVIHRSDEAIRCSLDGTIVSAPPPPRIVEKGVLGNRLIIEATADKFLEHQPIERQCLRFERSGVDISPQTLGRAVSSHLDLLEPLALAINEKTRAAGLLATDATSVAVLDPEYLLAVPRLWPRRGTNAQETVISCGNGTGSPLMLRRAAILR